MRLLLLIITLGIISPSVAQHHHYIYIQTQPQQPFYVKMSNEPLSSNTSGFLIIPKLVDTTYVFVAGFPQNAYPEYRFTLKGLKQDKGFTLRNFEDKGWGLIDNQTQEIQMGERVNNENQDKEYIPPARTNDAFTLILASVIDDPGLAGTELMNAGTASFAIHLPPVEKKQVPKVDAATTTDLTTKVKTETQNTTPPVVTNQPEKKNPPPPVVNTQSESAKIPASTASDKVKSEQERYVSSTPKPTATDDPKNAVKSAPAKASVRKLSTFASSEGMEFLFADVSENGKTDTVDVFIPKEITSSLSDQQKGVTENSTAPVATTKSVAPEVKNQNEAVQKTLPEITDTSKKTSSEKTGSVRSDCKKMATEKDVLSVRRKIVAIREVDDMVAAALRDFKSRCFTAEQIKSVSIVFITDEGKYKLMDAAYPYVYDSFNYSSLESLLHDNYYITRFRSLLK